GGPPPQQQHARGLRPAAAPGRSVVALSGPGGRGSPCKPAFGGEREVFLPPLVPPAQREALQCVAVTLGGSSPGRRPRQRPLLILRRGLPSLWPWPGRPPRRIGLLLCTPPLAAGRRLPSAGVGLRGCDPPGHRPHRPEPAESALAGHDRAVVA